MTGCLGIQWLYVQELFVFGSHIYGKRYHTLPIVAGFNFQPICKKICASQNWESSFPQGFRCERVKIKIIWTPTTTFRQEPAPPDTRSILCHHFPPPRCNQVLRGTLQEAETSNRPWRLKRPKKKGDVCLLAASASDSLPLFEGLGFLEKFRALLGITFKRLEAEDVMSEQTWTRHFFITSLPT